MHPTDAIGIWIIVPRGFSGLNAIFNLTSYFIKDILSMYSIVTTSDEHNNKPKRENISIQNLRYSISVTYFPEKQHKISLYINPIL